MSKTKIDKHVASKTVVFKHFRWGTSMLHKKIPSPGALHGNGQLMPPISEIDHSYQPIMMIMTSRDPWLIPHQLCQTSRRSIHMQERHELSVYSSPALSRMKNMVHESSVIKSSVGALSATKVHILVKKQIDKNTYVMQEKNNYRHE